MAGYLELDKFVKKFVSLWENGCDANLQVETTAGKAVVSLKVTLGQAKNLSGRNHNHGVYRGGSPSRQRRRERRAATRKAEATAEEAVAEGVDAVAEEEEDTKTDTGEVEAKVEVVMKECLETVEYELQVDAHKECKNYQLIEAIEVNFDGALDNRKVAKEDLAARKILVQKAQECKTTEMLEHDRKLLVYRVFINDEDNSRAVIESWKEEHMFDDLAFRGAIRDKINMRIRAIQRL